MIFTWKRIGYLNSYCWYIVFQNQTLYISHNFVPDAYNVQQNAFGLPDWGAQGSYSWVKLELFNATVINILVTWWSVLLVEETGTPRESHGPATLPLVTFKGNTNGYIDYSRPLARLELT